MLLDQDLNSIREAKKRLAVCCDLRRQLACIEIQGIRSGMGRSFLNLTLGLAVVEKFLALVREKKSGCGCAADSTSAIR